MMVIWLDGGHKGLMSPAPPTHRCCSFNMFPILGTSLSINPGGGCDVMNIPGENQRRSELLLCNQLIGCLWRAN